MDYSPTLCFAGFNSKRRKFQQERREKEKLQQFMSRQSSVYRDKRPSKWLRESDMTIFLLSQHKGLNIEERPLSRQDNLCRDTERQGFWSQQVMLT